MVFVAVGEELGLCEGERLSEGLEVGDSIGELVGVEVIGLRDGRGVDIEPYEDENKLDINYQPV